MRGRRITTVGALILAFAGSFSVQLARPAFANGLSVTYQPSPIAAAGDPYSISAAITATCSSFQERCGRISLTVYYIDELGVTQSINVQSPNGHNWMSPVMSVLLTAQIPGDKVRFPSLTHWLVVKQNSCNGGFYGCDPDYQPESQPGHQTATYTSPNYSTTVDNHLRLGFVTSTGAPAAGVDVVWGPRDNTFQLMWHTTADSSGHVDLVLPRDDPAVTAAAAGKGYINVSATAMTNKPSSAVPDGTIDVRTVQAATVVASLPLGSPYLAARPVIQDSAVSLQSQQVSFSPPPGHVGTYADAAECAGGPIPPFGYFSYCKQTMETWHEWMEQAWNIGADSGFTTDFRYSQSQSTTSTVGVNYGNGWTSSGGESTTSESNSASFSVSRTSWNYRVRIDWIWERAKHTSCELYFCGQAQIVSPRQWTGGHVVVDWGALGPHGTASGSQVPNNGGTDCVIPIDNNFTVAREDSYQTEHLLSGSADAAVRSFKVYFTVHYKNTGSAATSTTYTWTGTKTASEPYLHLFVDYAWKGNTMYCPPDSPDWTWTDRSSVLKGPYTPPQP